MISLAVVSLIAILLYLLVKDERRRKLSEPVGTTRKRSLWVLITILSLIALFSPNIKDRIRSLQKKDNFRAG